MLLIQCEGITKNGNQCRRQVQWNAWNVGEYGGFYCGLHRDQSSAGISVEHKIAPEVQGPPTISNFLFLFLGIIGTIFTIAMLGVTLWNANMCGFAILVSVFSGGIIWLNNWAFSGPN